MRVLVTGGAGYIGSHTVVALAAAGHEPVIVDNFSNAKPAVLDRLQHLVGAPVPCHTLDLVDAAATRELFAADHFDAVLHFAGLKAVAESVSDPLRYYRNNLDSTFSLLAAMAEFDVRTFVFSSSATVYGADAEVPMHEDAPLSAVNPYGQTKLAIEYVLRDLGASDERWHVGCLRYFNPAGAHPSGTIGEDPQGVPNNLMPLLAQVAVGRRDRLDVYGDDYPTPDGTCLRDYIHVQDLADGHVAALRALSRSQAPSWRAWNLGTGSPTSVLELVHAYEKAVGHELPHRIVERRPGDAAVSYADVSRAEAELGWRAERDVHQMCADSARWQAQNPNGYPST